MDRSRPGKDAMYSATVPTWMRQPVKLPRCRRCLAGPFGAGYEIAEAAYGEALSENSGLTAFAYLWRRFGPPWHGADHDQHLVKYILGTPNPDILLLLALRGSALPYGVGYLLTHTLEAEWLAPGRDWEKRFEAWWLAHQTTPEEQRVLRKHARSSQEVVNADPAMRALGTRFWADRIHNHAMRDAAVAAIGPNPRTSEAYPRAELAEALTAALQELLRPVFIRDVAINILGRVDDELLDERESAEVSDYAGYGIDKPAMDALLRKDEEVGIEDKDA